GVGDDERADEQRDAREDQQGGAHAARRLGDPLGLVVGQLPAGGGGGGVLGDDLVERVAQRDLGGAGGGLHIDLVVRAGFVEQVLGGGRVEEGEAAAGGDIAVVGGEDARDPRRQDGAVDRQPYGVADLVPGAPGGLGVDEDLVLPLRGVPA